MHYNLCLILLTIGLTSNLLAQFKDGPSAFNYLWKIAKSPRCVNCHGLVVDGVHRPTVGENFKIHPMNITDKYETLGHRCTTCHGLKNIDVPGAPPGASNKLRPGFHWQMPDRSMILGPNLTRTELCEIWTNPKKNGNRGSLKEISKLEREFIKHMRTDPLVHWAFFPGPGRTSAGTGADLKANVDELVSAVELWVRWLKAGNKCDDL